MIDVIKFAIFPEYDSKQQYLPGGCCSTCANKVSEIMSCKRDEPEFFENEIRNAQYLDICSELQSLSIENADCSCSICKKAKANPISKPALIKRPLPTFPDSVDTPNVFDDPEIPRTAPSTVPGISGTSATSDFSEPRLSAREIDQRLLCLECFSKLARGLPHTCNRTTRVNNLAAQLSPATLSRLGALTVKAEHERQGSTGKVLLETGGKPLPVSYGAMQPTVPMDHEFFFDIQRDNPKVSNNTLNRIAKSYRPWHGGKKAIKPHFSSALVESSEQLAKYFKWEWDFFEQYIPNTTYTEEVLKPLSFCTDVKELVKYVQSMRELGDDECILDLGIDGGGGTIKVTLNLIEPRTEILEPPKKTAPKKRKTPTKGNAPLPAGKRQRFSEGVTPTDNEVISDPSNSDYDPDYEPPKSSLPKPEKPASPKPSTSGSSQKKRPRFLSSGVKQLMIIASAAGVKETYENVKKILRALGLFDGVHSLNLGADSSLHTDLKEWNSLLGLQSHSSTYCCTWCEGKKMQNGEWEKGATRRTLGGIREKARQFQSALRKWYEKKSNPKFKKIGPMPKGRDFFGCVNEPLIYGNDWRSIYDVVPLPELHLLSGVTNHICNNLNDEWSMVTGEDAFYKWAEDTHSIRMDAHQGKGFKGNNARKILEKAHELALDKALPKELVHFAHALEAFNTVVIGSFGKYESKFILTEIYAFEKAYMKLGISVTPKAHAIFEHLPEFLELGYGPLGYYSEQATEASHYDFLPVWSNYPSNPLNLLQVGQQHHNALVKYNFLRVKRFK